MISPAHMCNIITKITPITVTKIVKLPTIQWCPTFTPQKHNFTMIMVVRFWKIAKIKQNSKQRQSSSFLTVTSVVWLEDQHVEMTSKFKMMSQVVLACGALFPQALWSHPPTGIFLLLEDWGNCKSADGGSDFSFNIKTEGLHQQMTPTWNKQQWQKHLKISVRRPEAEVSGAEIVAHVNTAKLSIQWKSGKGTKNL